MKITKELKSGIIGILAVAVLIWGYNYMKKQNLFNKSRVYYSKFNNVQGLSPASIVSINGFQVGNVTRVEFDPKQKGSFIVSYTLTNNFSFSDQSETKIKPPTISGMGSSELIIVPSYIGENAKSGSFLKGSIQQSLISSFTDKLDPMQINLNKVLKNADHLVSNLNNILDPSTQNNIKTAISKLNITLNSFKNASNSLDLMLAENKSKISSILTNFEKSSTNLDGITGEFKNANITASLKQTVTKFDNSLASLDKSLKSFDHILIKADKGNGSIAKLLNDDGLYNNLEKASKEMEELLREMKEHPKRFVHFSLFGKKDKKGYIKDSLK